MDFYWLYEDESTLILMGYEQEIARLEWQSTYEVWELKSKFLEAEMDMDIEYSQNDVDEVETAAIESLIDNCKEHIQWWQDQIDMLNEMND